MILTVVILILGVTAVWLGFSILVIISEGTIISRMIGVALLISVLAFIKTVIEYDS